MFLIVNFLKIIVSTSLKRRYLRGFLRWNKFNLLKSLHDLETYETGNYCSFFELYRACSCNKQGEYCSGDKQLPTLETEVENNSMSFAWGVYCVQTTCVLNCEILYFIKYFIWVWNMVSKQTVGIWHV